MGKIRLKNFGPIKDGVEGNGWIDIQKVTVFIGNQGSGKSTIIKLIASFSWIEKQLLRDGYNITWFEKKDRFKDHILKYHRLENYVTNNTYIEYEGNAFRFVYNKNKLSITEKNIISCALPQVMFIPAERNIISSIKRSKKSYSWSGNLKDFLAELNKPKNLLHRSAALDKSKVNTAFVTFIEEPEQNLSPNSQKEVLHTLLVFNHLNEGSKLIFTTHSPFLLNYLTLSVKADELKNRIRSKDYINKLNLIVPIESTIKKDQLLIYHMDTESGSINLLETYRGLPTDKHILNKMLEDSNELFEQLLEIEQEIS